MCARDLGRQMCSLWFVACSAPSHYLNQWLLVVNLTFRNKFQWDFIQMYQFPVNPSHRLQNVGSDLRTGARRHWAKEVDEGSNSGKRSPLSTNDNRTFIYIHGGDNVKKTAISLAEWCPMVPSILFKMINYSLTKLLQSYDQVTMDISRSPTYFRRGSRKCPR